MAKRLVLVPVNLGSQGAKALAEKLTARVGHKVWRCKPESINGRVAFRLRPGTDKLTQFNKFKEHNVSCPGFGVSMDAARTMLASGPVVCRTILRGSEGRGIVIAETVDELVQAPLYTQYVKKKKEFRVHVLNGQVIDVQEKRRKGEFNGERDTRIRNVANGYVFCRNDVVEPELLRTLAVSSTEALGYGLGAVDIVYNEHNRALYTLEVNSTPGMEGTTLEKYADAIVSWYKEQA